MSTNANLFLDVIGTSENNMIFIFGVNLQNKSIFKNFVVSPKLDDFFFFSEHMERSVEQLLCDSVIKYTNNILSVTYTPTKELLFVEQDTTKFRENFLSVSTIISSADIVRAIIFTAHLLHVPARHVLTLDTNTLLLNFMSYFGKQPLPRNFSRRTLRGGLHLEETSGFHTNILCLDFDSMYPSIICANKHLFSDDYAAFISCIEYVLTRKRSFNAGDIRRNICKRILNAFYGLTNFRYSALYNPEITQNVCEKGRELLLALYNFLERIGYTTIYGCTDSVYIKKRSGDIFTEEEIEKIQRKLKKNFVLGPYIFRVTSYSSLFIVSKNHMVGLKQDSNIEHCGTMVKRKAFSDAEKMIFNDIIRLILMKKDLSSIAQKISVINQELQTFEHARFAFGKEKNQFLLDMDDKTLDYDHYEERILFELKQYLSEDQENILLML